MPELFELLEVFAGIAAAFMVVTLVFRSTREPALPLGDAVSPEDVSRAGLDPGVVKLLRDAVGEPVVLQGAGGRVGIAAPCDAGLAYDALDRVRRSFTGSAVAFLSERVVTGGLPTSVAIIRASEPLAALEFMGTRHRSRIEPRLRAWLDRYALDLAGCGEDWVELRLRGALPDSSLFDEAATLWPKAVAAAGGPAALVERANRTGLLHLWWE